jgi:putative sigma-54 modulation protein
MQLMFSFKHMESSAPLREFAENKIREKIEKFSTKPIEAHFTFSVDNHSHHAHISIKGGDGFSFQVDASSADMYGTIDLLVDKMETQLKRKKEKLKKHKFKDNIRQIRPSLDSEDWDSAPIDAEDLIKYERARQKAIGG